MSNKNSLSFQVLKGKYFHSADPWKIDANGSVSFL